MNVIADAFHLARVTLARDERCSLCKRTLLAALIACRVAIVVPCVAEGDSNAGGFAALPGRGRAKRRGRARRAGALRPRGVRRPLRPLPAARLPLRPAPP